MAEIVYKYSRGQPKAANFTAWMKEIWAKLTSDSDLDSDGLETSEIDFIYSFIRNFHTFLGTTKILAVFNTFWPDTGVYEIKLNTL